MRVLLVSPPAARNFYSHVGLNLMPLGIGYLAGMLEREGHEVSILDLQVREIPEDSVNFSGWDLVGLSSDTLRMNSALRLGRKARAAGVPVVFGGYHATFLDEEPLAKGAADYVVRGEGEYVLAQLAQTLERGGDLSAIKGLTYQSAGGVRRNPEAGLIENLDELPYPARWLFPTELYLKDFQNRLATTVLTSRGCPFNCYFCAITSFSGIRWRTRSLDSIFLELADLMRQGYSGFVFLDDNFTLDERRVMNFCREVIARHWDIRWWCFSRADTLAQHPQMVREMALAGCQTVFLGLESGNQTTLDQLQKKITLEQQRVAVRLLKDHGISAYGSFMLGELHETRRMLKRTVRFALSLHLDACQFSLLTPYPGSRLYRQMEASRQLSTHDWDLYDGVHLVFKNPAIGAPALEKLVRRAYLRFYLRLCARPVNLKQLLFNPRKLIGQFQLVRRGMRMFRKMNS